MWNVEVMVAAAVGAVVGFILGWFARQFLRPTSTSGSVGSWTISCVSPTRIAVKGSISVTPGLRALNVIAEFLEGSATATTEPAEPISAPFQFEQGVAANGDFEFELDYPTMDVTKLVLWAKYYEYSASDTKTLPTCP